MSDLPAIPTDFAEIIEIDWIPNNFFDFLSLDKSFYSTFCTSTDQILLLLHLDIFADIFTFEDRFKLVSNSNFCNDFPHPNFRLMLISHRKFEIPLENIEQTCNGPTVLDANPHIYKFHSLDFIGFVLEKYFVEKTILASSFISHSLEGILDELHCKSDFFSRKFSIRNQICIAILDFLSNEKHFRELYSFMIYDTFEKLEKGDYIEPKEAQNCMEIISISKSNWVLCYMILPIFDVCSQLNNLDGFFRFIEKTEEYGKHEDHSLKKMTQKEISNFACGI